jgi:hypothetical protein
MATGADTACKFDGRMTWPAAEICYDQPWSDDTALLSRLSLREFRKDASDDRVTALVGQGIFSRAAATFRLQAAETRARVNTITPIRARSRGSTTVSVSMECGSSPASSAVSSGVLPLSSLRDRRAFLAACLTLSRLMQLR